jgi:hypothetical protein
MNLKRVFFRPICVLILASACAVNQDFYLNKPDRYSSVAQNAIDHTVYFLGNSDRVKPGTSDTGQLLSKQIDESGKNTTLLLLGNNSVRNVTLKSDSSRRAREKLEQLKARHDFFDDLDGKYYAVLGPHEWGKGSRFGMHNARILDEFLEDELDQGDAIRPDAGCPGPEEIEIGMKIILLLIDTQWLFHNWSKPGMEDGCDVDSNLDFYVNLQDAILRHYDKQIIVAGYHSLAGNGRHGGYFPARSHLIPLPFLGSLRVGLRSWLGNPMDLANPTYQVFINTMKDILMKHENIIYLSSHEQTLEHHQWGSTHLLNSGSYSRGVEVGQEVAKFASGEKGYGRLLFLHDGQCIVEYWTTVEGKPKNLYQKKLFDHWNERAIDEDIVEKLDFSDSTKTSHASDMYTKKQKRPGMMGNNYREEWITPVRDIPYFDIEKEDLEIVKRGGGQQTKSLRLEDKDDDDKQYVLRSIEKYPHNAVPDELRNTVAVDVVVDQISAAHPYGAFVIPRMADAAGIYHTNPKLVYLPDDPRLGRYRQTFGDGLYLYEERPAKNREDIASFGRSDDIVNTAEVLEEIREDGDHYVDQEFALRCRLFDIFIGDWDRHDDQWRWATFEDEEGDKYYRPIPRDRDQVFFWSDGWLMKLASHNWGIAKFQGFHHEIRDIDGLNFNGRYFDRSFINEPNRETWISIARDIQRKLTDEVIENAIKEFPEEIFSIHGEEIISKLKSRRDDLHEYAEEYYLFLSKNVNVYGSDKNEHFIVERVNDYQTKVTVMLLKTKSGKLKREMYERVFLTSETDEIRLYGFKGDDIFELTGDVSKGIRVRIIGGKGDDVIEDRSSVKGIGKKTVVYDTKKNTSLKSDGETLDKTTDRNPLINDYNRKMFQYNLVAPIIYPSYNPDDGIYIGAGVLIKNHGFRKYPFKNRHIIKADIAPKSQSYDFSYSGTFTDAIGRWDFILNANAFVPSYADYFYGYGNETEFDMHALEQDSRHYSARYIQYIFYPEIQRRSTDERHHFTFGGGYQSVNVKSELNNLNPETERFIVSYARTLEYDLLDVQRHYLAVYGSYTFDNTDNEFMPKQGLRWNLFLIDLQDVDHHAIDVNFQRLRSDISYYYTFGRFLKSTLALRIGGAVTNGNFEFYHASKIGGSTNFRGVRKFRFAGQHSFYQNTDLRIKLFNIRNPLLPVSVGVVGFHDFGRVWYNDDPSTREGTSEKLHRAYGGGIWLAPLNKISFGLDYSMSTLDEQALYLRMGFFF